MGILKEFPLLATLLGIDTPNDRRERSMSEIQDTLGQRQTRYGDFDIHAHITQRLKRAMSDTKGWDVLTDDKKEALEMIAHKIGRILNGDPEYKDSWHDIVGYAKLVDDTLEDE